MAHHADHMDFDDRMFIGATILRAGELAGQSAARAALQADLALQAQADADQRYIAALEAENRRLKVYAVGLAVELRSYRPDPELASGPSFRGFTGSIIWPD